MIVSEVHRHVLQNVKTTILPNATTAIVMDEIGVALLMAV